MKKILFFSLVACGALLTACKTPVTMSNRTARSTEMPIETWASWTTADLDVSDQKVRLTVEAPKDDKILMTESQMKENAIGEALEKYNADVLINPLFTTEFVDGKLVRVTVSGYPARHKNFRTISYEEQSQFLLEKEKAANAPQIVINGGEIKNEVAAPAPMPCPEDKPAKNSKK